MSFDSVSERLPKVEAALSVSELTQRIKSQLESTYPSVAVQGEISNFKRHSSGHLYFSLKDEGAQIQVALFHTSAQKLTFEPRDGDRVTLRGELSVYSQRGQYQLIARTLEKVGMGEILLRLEALKRELKALGWFDASRKKPLPSLPDRIGVVTSPTGAVIRDILHVLRLRHPGFHLLLYPARVQGEGAAEEIARGVRFFNEHRLCDVLIVARGGGSFEDLMPFNERLLLEAVEASEIPVISAVGHETDFTLCDFVADYRAPTPSAAAERVIAPKRELQEKLSYLTRHLHQGLQGRIEQGRLRLRAVQQQRLLAEPINLLLQIQQQLDDLEMRLEQRARELLGKQQVRLNELTLTPFLLSTLYERAQQALNQCHAQLQLRSQQLQHEASQRLAREQQRVDQLLLDRLQNGYRRLEKVRVRHSPQLLKQHFERCQRWLESTRELLKALSPESALRRGYAILRHAKQHPLQSAQGLMAGDLIQIQMHDANIWSLVQRIDFNSLDPS